MLLFMFTSGIFNPSVCLASEPVASLGKTLVAAAEEAEGAGVFLDPGRLWQLR